MRSKHAVSISSGVLVAIATGAIAYAQSSSNHTNDALQDLAKAKVSITQAITTAEQTANGKATRAELENERHGLIYKVEVANADTHKVMDVHVDGVSGKVMSSKEDKADHGKDEADND